MLKNWTKADDEKLKLLDSYGVAIGDMAKIIGVSYRSVHARLNRIRNMEDNQEPNDNNEERLATKEIRENICLMYITNMTEKKNHVASREVKWKSALSSVIQTVLTGKYYLILIITIWRWDRYEKFIYEIKDLLIRNTSSNA